MCDAATMGVLAGASLIGSLFGGKSKKQKDPTNQIQVVQAPVAPAPLANEAPVNNPLAAGAAPQIAKADKKKRTQLGMGRDALRIDRSLSTAGTLTSGSGLSIPM